MSYCQLKIPLKSFPYFKYENFTPSDIMEYLIKQKLYANIEIGTPKKSVDLPLEFYSNDFYIGDNPKNYYNSTRFSEFNFYISNESKTYKRNYEDKDEFAYDGDIFSMGMYVEDNIYFNNIEYKMNFYLAYLYFEVNPGGIGLQLQPRRKSADSTPNKERTFFENLKKSELIKNYHWSIFFNSKENKKDDEGFLLLGCLPHELNSDLGYYKKEYFNEKNIRTINIAMNTSNVDNIIEMNEIMGYEGDDVSKIIEDFNKIIKFDLKVELDYHSGGVIFPNYLQPFYHRVFEEYINKKECFNDTFDFGLYSFYYCKKDKNILSKIKNTFPGVKFKNNDLSFNFYLEADDLFIEEKDYIFCLIYFEKNNKGNTLWKLGKPFLKKYQFIINYDEKYIKFYTKLDEKNIKKEEEKTNNGVSYSVYIISIIIAVIIVIIICFLIYKFYLYDKYFRKKRANELDDNDYEYVSRNDKENLNIN
jgi:hypothetical protein